MLLQQEMSKFMGDCKAYAFHAMTRVCKDCTAAANSVSQEHTFKTIKSVEFYLVNVQSLDHGNNVCARAGFAHTG